MIEIKNNLLNILKFKKKIFLFISNCLLCNKIKNKIKKIEKKIKILFFVINIKNNIIFCIKNNILVSPTIIFDFKKKNIYIGKISIKNILREILLFKR